MNLKSLNENLRYKIPNEWSNLYKNKIVKHILRIGKYGIILLNGKEHILFHLGMTGKFRFTKKVTIMKNMIIFQLSFNNGIILNYNDVRKFGYFSNN